MELPHEKGAFYIEEELRKIKQEGFELVSSLDDEFLTLAEIHNFDRVWKKTVNLLKGVWNSGKCYYIGFIQNLKLDLA